MHPPSRRRRAATTLLLGAALAVGGLVTPAAAHSEDGTMEIISAESPSPLEISIEVGVVYANDDDIAAEASVLVTATADDGVIIGPIEVPNESDGVYATVFQVPSAGSWSLEVASTDPAAEATGVVEVGDLSSTTASTPATSDATTPTTDVTTASEEPSTTSTSVAADTTATAAAGDDEAESDDESSNLVPIAAIAVLALAGITAVVVLGRRNRSADSPGAEPGADSDPEGDTDGAGR